LIFDLTELVATAALAAKPMWAGPEASIFASSSEAGQLFGANARNTSDVDNRLDRIRQ